MKKKEINLKLNIKKKDFEIIYNKYFNSLCSFAYKYFQDITLVEDLVQETFISIWDKRADFTSDLTVKSYLYTSVKNKCINYLKHLKVRQKNEVNIIQELESDQNFNHTIIKEETFNILFQEIKNLPEASKKIMLLALNGLKNPEIAEELNVSINTVKTQKKIAYSKLKIKLKPKEYAILLTL